MIWKYIALATLAMFWLSLAILLTKWPRVHHKSISQHSAANRESYIFFTISQVITGLVLYLFMIKWFIPEFKLSLGFTIIYTITQWLQIISAVIPDKGTNALGSRIHRYMAYAMAIGIMFSAVLLCFATNIHGFSKAVIVLMTIYLVTSFGYLIYEKKKKGMLDNFLYLQVIYVVSFQASLLIAAFFK